MTEEDTDYVLLEQLASEFAARVRAGQRPSVEEYCARHPAVAADLREMLPPLAGLVVAREALDMPPPGVVRHEKRLGDYLLLREIGRGGMGVVYEAEQVSLGRRVAIKLLPSYASNSELAARFEREARTAGRLHHTNIVPVFGVGRDGGTLFYVMQFIPGQGLDAVITELRRLRDDEPSTIPTARPAVARSLVNGRFEARPAPDTSPDLTAIPPPDDPTNGFGIGKTFWESVARVGVQVADALDYAHKQGVLHRDIKPSNLLLDPTGTVWVADFGLAKAVGQESLTADGALLGTLRYLPPEGLNGRMDARSDVYSLGLTLYELAALRPAYPEPDRHLLMHQIGNTAPDLVTTVTRSIPRDLATVIHKAIEREANRRYQTTADLAADLRRFLAGKPVKARWVGPVERLIRWCRLHPIPAGLMAVLGFLAMTSTAAVVSAAKDHDRLGHTEDLWATAEVRADREAARADAAEYHGKLARAAFLAADGHREGAAKLLAECRPDRRGWEWDYLDALAHGRATRRELPPPAAGGLAFDADGERMVVATANPPGVAVVEVETGAELTRLPDDVRAAGPVVLSADGARVAVAVGAGDEFGVWDVGDGKPVFRRKVPGVRFTHLALSGNGGMLAAAGTRTVRLPGGRELRDQFLGVWNVVSGKELPAPPPPADPVSALAFDPTGGRFAWAAGPGHVGVWNVATGRLAATWNPVVDVDALAFAPDGRRLAGATGIGVRLWDATTGAEVFDLPAAGGVGAKLRFGGDGRSLAFESAGRLTAWAFTPPIEDAGPPRPARE